MSNLEQRKQAFKEVQSLIYKLSRDGAQDCNCITKSKDLGKKLTKIGIEE